MVKRVGQWARAAVLAAAACGGLLAVAGPAEAALYIWNVDANGSWTTASNWLYAGGGAANAWGYPSAASDQAFFTGEYTAARTVTIPANVAVTVGTIYFGGPQRVDVVGSATSRLSLNNGASAAQVITTSNNATFALSVTILLRSSLQVTVNPGSVLFLSRMIEDGGIRTLTKRGGGVLALTQANGYTGVTRIEQGPLRASVSGGGAIPGDLEVGTGAVGTGANAELSGDNQLQPTAAIEVREATLTLFGSQRAGRLRVTRGLVDVSSTDVTVQELTLAGGAMEFISSFTLPPVVTATSSAGIPSTLSPRFNAPADASLRLAQVTTFMVNDGPEAVDLAIDSALSGASAASLIKDGTGTMRFSGTRPNTYSGTTQVRAGVLELARSERTTAIPSLLEVGFGSTPAVIRALSNSNIDDRTRVTVGARGTFESSAVTEQFGTLQVDAGGLAALIGPAGLAVTELVMTGGRLSLAHVNSVVVVLGSASFTSTGSEASVIDGAGLLALAPAQPLVVADGPQPIDLRLGVGLGTAGDGSNLIKRGAGAILVERSAPFNLIVEEGAFLVTGAFARDVRLTGGRLGGTGVVGAVTASGGRLAPGLSPGRLTTGDVTLNGALEIEVNGVEPGSYDQLDVRGAVTLGDAVLALTAGFAAPRDSRFTIIANDGTDPVSGTFANLPEGGTIRAGGQTFAISYRGGDGNDVELAATTQLTYYLAEGATGAFFDDDLLVANPNDRDAPITLLFMKEGGSTIAVRRVAPAMGRLTVAVDQIPGLESAAASVQVTSDDRLPLVVERSMFWDESYYGGHTANAVAQPETRWIFAEGFQGFFDTYILIANAEATPTTATLTFLREGAPPVVATVPVGAFSRRTVYAGDYPALKDRAFGIVVDATQPVIAERAMYFASQPGRLWAGGHANTGIVTPSRSWFHAEGATGGYFSTFILLSNPQITPAQVTLRFLLPNGDVITRTKTLAAQQRLTVNPAGEGDVRLQNAAVSTVVEADVPIVSERSMYWPGEAAPFGEGHNSSGLAGLGTRWGLAEGRIGGPHAFDTFILLANPSTTAAQVTITYLRDGGAPIVRTHTVPATSRFNVDVKASVPELRDSAFGARIDVTNAVPIAVERSLYWNANGVFWAGGSNALGTPLP